MESKPLKDSFDFAMPKEAYFANVDWVIDRAAERGIQVVLTPSYVGFDSGEGWQDQMVANGTSKCRSYGRFLGKRYRTSPKFTVFQYRTFTRLKQLEYLIRTKQIEEK